jgi:type II secretory pathway pseudopilin PulG
VKVNKTKMLALFQKAFEIQNNRPLVKSEEDELNQFFNFLDKSTIDIWVTDTNNYLRKLTIKNPSADFGAIALASEIQIEFSDFNTTIVDKPSGAIAFDDTLKTMVNENFGLTAAQRKARDARRVADIRQIQLALELYADANKQKYPRTLSVLAPKFIYAVPTDPTGNVSYSYAVNDSLASYHLGGSLEGKDSTALQTDADCNSKTGINCKQKLGFDKTAAFDGSDSKGCRGEANRYCYDVVSSW